MEDERRDRRYRVHFSVRYGRARDFVVEYAENLSFGGLFIRGAHHLAPRESVNIVITLPGFASFCVAGEVAHILPPDRAQAAGRLPGAGIALTQRPAGFDAALHSYLQRLGRRRDVCVLATDKDLARQLEGAGYQVGPAPPPAALAATIAASQVPVIAVVVPREQVDVYFAVAATGSVGAVRIYSTSDLDSLLAALDELL